MNKSEKVRNFISRYVRVSELENDDDIFKAGSVNSLFAMQLIVFLENEFKIKVENDDLDMKNFCTINSILDFINKKS